MTLNVALLFSFWEKVCREIQTNYEYLPRNYQKFEQQMKKNKCINNLMEYCREFSGINCWNVNI